MKRISILPTIVTVFAVFIGSQSFAGSEQIKSHAGIATNGMAHGMPSTTGQAMKMDSIDVILDGDVYSFMAMKNEMHRGMLDRMKVKEEIEPGTTHNVMVVLKQMAEELPKGMTAKIGVIDPDGRQEIKAGHYKEMMKSYDAYFALTKKGRYRISLMLIPQEGADRQVGVSYEVK